MGEVLADHFKVKDNHTVIALVKEADSVQVSDFLVGDYLFPDKFILDGEVEVLKKLTMQASQRDKLFTRLNASMFASFEEMALFEDESIRPATVNATEKNRLVEI